MRLLAAFLLLFSTAALAQSSRVDMRATTLPGQSPQPFEVLDSSGNWSKFGTVDPATHIFTPTSASQFLPIHDVGLYGAVGDGVADDTDEINACLAAIPVGDACYAGQKRYYIAGLVAIPVGRTLMCGFSPMDYSTWGTPPWSALNVVPALLVNPTTGSIKATGYNAQLLGCLVENSKVHWPVNDGQTYPQGGGLPNTSVALYGGIAFDDQKNHGVRVRDASIFGFDTALWARGPRAVWDHILADGNGVNKAVYEWDVGNTDSGTVTDVEMATGYTQAFNCGTMHRPGTGFRVGGPRTTNPPVAVGAASLFIYGRNVIQGMETAQYDFDNSVIADALWADQNYTQCGWGTGIGIHIRGFMAGQGGPFITASRVTSDQQHIGVQIDSGAEVHVSDIFVGGHDGDGMVIGDDSQVATTVYDGGSTVVGGGYASNPQIRFKGTGPIRFNTRSLRVNTGTSPFILLDSTSNMFFGGEAGSLGDRSFAIGSLATNLAGGVSPYGMASTGKWLASSGSGAEIARIAPTAVACTGLGSTGTCNLFNPGVWNDSFSGVVQLKPSGTGIATNGTVTLTMPFPALTASMCTGALAGGSSVYPGTNVYALPWSGTLASGGTYQFLYRCNWS